MKTKIAAVLIGLMLSASTFAITSSINYVDPLEGCASSCPSKNTAGCKMNDCEFRYTPESNPFPAFVICYYENCGGDLEQ